MRAYALFVLAIGQLGWAGCAAHTGINPTPVVYAASAPTPEPIPEGPLPFEVAVERQLSPQCAAVWRMTAPRSESYPGVGRIVLEAVRRSVTPGGGPPIKLARGECKALGLWSTDISSARIRAWIPCSGDEDFEATRRNQRALTDAEALAAIIAGKCSSTMYLDAKLTKPGQREWEKYEAATTLP